MRLPLGYRTGFTLLELVLSLAISSVLAFAVASAIMVSSRSVPKPNNAATISSSLGMVDDAIRTDLELATTIVSIEPHRIEFLIADRDGDEIEERVELQWSGQAGDPLTRRINSGTSVPLVTAVQQFNSSVEYAAESIFQGTSRADPLAAILDSGYTDGGWSPISSGRRIGIRVAPSGLGPDTRWRITRTDFYLRWKTPKTNTNVLVARIGRDVPDTTDPFTYSYTEILAGDISADGQWKQLPLRTPWLPHNQSVLVSLYNQPGNTTVDFRMKHVHMPEGLRWQSHALNQWVLMTGASVSVRIAYETITPVASEQTMNTADVVTLQMEFPLGVPPVKLLARPVARAEQQQ